ncbi:MAG: molecular chaperone TorD family protein [Burkholderiales bacterium]|nr:molecular chaperone TorD family protein [Burkholderiales bacterium]
MNAQTLPGPADAGELARAEIYGLLARLWLAAPDAGLLQRLAGAPSPPPGAWLEAPWQALVAALRATTPAEAAAEFDALFGGVGKPELFAYASYHLSGFLNEKPLAALRADLARLGLAREPRALETEDHVAYGFEVMRYLIAGGDAVCNLPAQRRYFGDHLQPWVERFCETVAAHPRAVVWAALARYTAEFMRVEAQGFELFED